MNFSVANILRPAMSFKRGGKVPTLTVHTLDGADRQVDLTLSASARAGVISSSESELTYAFANGLSGYLVEFGNRASFSTAQNSYSQSFEGGERLRFTIDVGDSDMPTGCALYLIVFDEAGNRLQQFHAGVDRRTSRFDAALDENARKGCFALRLFGKGKLLPIQITVSPAGAGSSDKWEDRPVPLQKIFAQTYRTENSYTDYLKGITQNLQMFERVAIREKSLRTRELLARAITEGALSYDEVVAFFRNMRGLAPAGNARNALRLSTNFLRGLLSLARVVFSQALRPEDAGDALDILEAVHGIEPRVFRQVDWILFTLLSTEFRGAEPALSILLGAHFESLNRIEPALLMSNILHRRATENGLAPDPRSYLLPLNRQLQAMSLEPVGVKPGVASPFLSLETGSPDSVVADGPKISVLMTTFDPDEKLDIAVRSVLGQSWRNLELIIIDDCSQDDLFAKVKAWEDRDPRVRVIRSPKNRGTYAAKNLGLQQAKGEFVTCHDSDDWSHTRKLELQMEVLAANPDSLAVFSHWVRTTSDLVFRPFSAKGYLCYENLSSMLYRREPVDKLVGYYDAVRTGADSEFKKRLERASGKPSLTTGKVPLSFGLLHDRSLTSTSLGLGWFSPDRAEYRIAFRKWHEALEQAGHGYRLEAKPKKRPFAVRPSLLPNRPATSSEPKQYDVVIMGEFRMVGGNTLSSIEEMKAQYRAGLKTAICHVSSFRKGVFHKEFYPPQIHAMLNSGEIDQIDLTSEVSTKVLNIRYPAIFQFAQGLKTGIKADIIQIIANQPPSEADSRDRRYDVAQCIANIREIFGVDPKWLPIGPSVRDALGEVPAHLLSSHDWFNIIDVEEWAGQRKGFVSDRPVIGRHGRDDASKWPETAEALYAAYPDDPRYAVRVLGGAQAIQAEGFSIPANWEVLPFNSVQPADFLRTIDFFVYFHHTQRIEAFGRTVIEAMASGCVVILPESFRPLFGDAAVYCSPQDVRAVVDSFYADPEKYRAQAENSLRYVRENFGYEMHLARLAEIGVRPSS